MKILLLSDPASAHTVKWVKYLTEEGIEVILFGITKYDGRDYSSFNNLRIINAGINKDYKVLRDGSFSKLIYLKSFPLLMKTIRSEQPDILHAHYLSSYGLLGALTLFKPFVVSVWGSDIYNFPSRSILHKIIIKTVLLRAQKILSTSRIMAEETQKYTNKTVTVTPFGVDVNLFYPEKRFSLFNKNDFVIGTIKSMEKKYGIDILIKSFAEVKTIHPTLPLKLLIVGDGSLLNYYKKMVYDLGLSDYTIFTGYIAPEQIPNYQNMLNISCILSREESESFGVSAIEASACGIPVIATKIGGLPEVVENNITGILVEVDNVTQVVEAINKLINDDSLRSKMGKNGRKKVIDHFEIKKCVSIMLSIYKSLI